MPTEIHPSSYLYDCGHQSDFFENTVRDIKRLSFRRKQYLADSEPDEHIIAFFRGEMVDIICPRGGTALADGPNGGARSA